MKSVTIKNKPVIFNNKDFQSIQIKVFFPFKRDEKKFALFDVLPGMLHSVCKKYPTEESFRNAIRKLYILSLYCRNYMIGDMCYYVMTLNIPNKEVLGNNFYEEQLALFSEMIYNPKIINNEFSEKELSREIDNIKVDIEKLNKDNVSYAILKTKEIVDDVGLLSSSIYNHMEQLDEVNTHNLYDYYQKNIYNNQPLIYIMGDVDQNEFNKLCDKYLFKNRFKNKKVSINIKNYLLPRSEVKNIVEESEFNNSLIAYVYKVKNMQQDDEILLNTIKELLSSLSSRLLNKKLRDENDLVYSSFASSINSFGLFGIFALINKDNVELVKEKILEVVQDLKNEEITNPLLDNIKERYRLSLIRNLDEKVLVLRNNIIKDTGIDYTNEEYYEKLINVTSKDVSKFIDRLVLDTIYFLKENDHE